MSSSAGLEIRHSSTAPFARCQMRLFADNTDAAHFLHETHRLPGLEPTVRGHRHDIAALAHILVPLIQSRTEAAAWAEAAVPTGLAGLWQAVQMPYRSARSAMRLDSNKPPDLGMSICTPEVACLRMIWENWCKP